MRLRSNPNAIVSKYQLASDEPIVEKKMHPLAHRMPLFDFYRKGWRQLNHVKGVARLYHMDNEAMGKSVKKLKQGVFFLAAERTITSLLMYNVVQRTFGYTAYNPGFSAHEQTVKDASTISGFVVNSAISAIPAHKQGAYEFGFTAANYSLAAARTLLEQYMLNARGINMDFATQYGGSYWIELLNQIYKFKTIRPMSSEQNIRFQATSAWGEIARMAGDVAMLVFVKKLLPLARNRLKENGMGAHMSLHQIISEEAANLQKIAENGGAGSMFASDRFLKALRLKQA